MPENQPSQEKPPGGEMPSIRIPDKKVDSSWKEEMRKEREALRGAAQAGSPPGAPGGAAEAPGPAAAGAASAAGAQTAKLFVNFLAGLVQQVLMQMGLVENPYTGQREVDLEGARHTIDLLTVLQQKTKGNLSAQEARVLNDSLRDLQLNYVEVAKAVGKQMKEQAEKQAKGGRK